jgi:hypothetical protein
MNHCQTCAHFKSDLQMSPRYLPLGDGWGVCQLSGSDRGTPDASKTLAYAEDSEHYIAWLNVREEFGCVQWSAT